MEFPSIAEAARAQFRVNLKAFLTRYGPDKKGWTKSSLLRVAGMDMSLIRRSIGDEDGTTPPDDNGFSVLSLDKLQAVMQDISAGKIKLPVERRGRKPKNDKGKKSHGRNHRL